MSLSEQSKKGKRARFPFLTYAARCGEAIGSQLQRETERRNYLLLCRIPKKYADEAAGELLQVLGRGK